VVAGGATAVVGAAVVGGGEGAAVVGGGEGAAIVGAAVVVGVEGAAVVGGRERAAVVVGGEGAAVVGGGEGAAVVREEGAAVVGGEGAAVGAAFLVATELVKMKFGCMTQLVFTQLINLAVLWLTFYRLFLPFTVYSYLLPGGPRMR
jgi:hypothetical protein